MQTKKRPGDRLKRAGILFLVVGFVLFFGATYLLFVKSFGFGIPCTFSFVTGLDCPGCGMTGAAFSILRLDFAGAFRRNALSVTVMPALLVYGIYKASVWVYSGRGSGISGKEKAFLIAMALLIVVYSVMRNIV